MKILKWAGIVAGAAACYFVLIGGVAYALGWSASTAMLIKGGFVGAVLALGLNAIVNKFKKKETQPQVIVVPQAVQSNEQVQENEQEHTIQRGRTPRVSGRRLATQRRGRQNGIRMRSARQHTR